MVVAGWLLPLYWNDSYVLDVLIITGLFVLLATGLSVVVSLAGLLDLGYVAFWAVGAYVAALLSSSQLHLSLPFLLIVPAALVVTSVFAVVIGFPTLRLRGDYLAVVTLGFGEIVRIFLINAEPLTGGPAGIVDIARPSLLGYSFTYRLEPYYYLIYGLCLGGLILARWLRRKPIGLIWQALRDDELAATTCGVRPLSYLSRGFRNWRGLCGHFWDAVRCQADGDFTGVVHHRWVNTRSLDRCSERALRTDGPNCARGARRRCPTRGATRP